MSAIDLGTALLAHARHAIALQLGVVLPPPPSHPDLGAPGATFVTLKQDGALRGCIGSLETRRALGTDVEANAVAAAFGDPRFSPLAARELDITDIEVSVLSPSEPMRVRDERDLVQQLVPGVDGVTLDLGRRRGTFLPQVWESLPDPEDFVAELKQKAGLPRDFWSPDIVVSRYRVQKFREPVRVTEGVR